MNAELHSTNPGAGYTGPDNAAVNIDALREEAMGAGAMDPLCLRFRIVEFDKRSGEMLGVPVDDIGFSDAIARTASLIQARSDSHFCLEPVGFIQ